MDITDNMLVETPAAPVVLRPAPEPEAACLPMLHIAAPHHPLEAAPVQKVGLACRHCAGSSCLLVNAEVRGRDA